MAWKCKVTALLLMGALSGCVNVATTGAQAIYNHHSIENNFNDQYLTYQAYQGVTAYSVELKGSNVSVTAFNGDILVVGQVENAWQKAKVTQIVKQVTERDHVHNLLVISSPASSMTRMSDGWITTKIKAKLITSADVDATQVKVITENGTVYLMGALPPDQIQAATEIASETDGVISVVRLFSTVNIKKV